jgi:hypothetical protein
VWCGATTQCLLASLVLHNLDVIPFLHHQTPSACPRGRIQQRVKARCTAHTFHLSISSCCFLYCFSSSSSTCFRPSELVLSAGSTSLTVRSTSTPLISRKHLRVGGRVASVSLTSLVGDMREKDLK